MEMQKTNLQLEFRIWLQEEYARRRRGNLNYSIRSFAKYLKMDSSALSQILSGKRNVSEKLMERVYSILESRPPINPESMSSSYFLVQSDMFSVVSDWYHFAILDLTLLKSFKNDHSWIASKLNISVLEVQLAVDRMKRLGLLVEKNKKLYKAKNLYTNYTDGVTSSAHKEYQRQIISKSLAAIDNCPQERKDITGITIAGNSKKINEVKNKIKNFRRDICRYMEDGDGDSVYHLAIQLYPVTSFEEEK